MDFDSSNCASLTCLLAPDREATATADEIGCNGK